MAIETWKSAKDWILIALVGWVGVEERTGNAKVETLIVKVALQEDKIVNISTALTLFKQEQKDRDGRQDALILDAAIIPDNRYWQEKKRTYLSGE